MLENGYIMLHRSLLKWEWYDDINTCRLFLHLLLTVNHYDEQWRGITVARGSRVSSYGKLSKETGLSVQNIRTSIKRLISTRELTHQTTSEYGLFTIVNYDKYQDATNIPTVSQQSANSQPTVSQQLSKKAKNIYPPISPLEIPSEIADAWDSYVEMRNKLKKPLTEKAMELALKKLQKLAPDDYETQSQILEQSVFNSWQGLFALKGDKSFKSNSDEDDFTPPYLMTYL